jgi:hypothetical protein
MHFINSNAFLFIKVLGEVQLAKKERTYEPKSKFDKTYNIFFKVLSQYDICRN